MALIVDFRKVKFFGNKGNWLKIRLLFLPYKGGKERRSDFRREKPNKLLFLKRLATKKKTKKRRKEAKEEGEMIVISFQFSFATFPNLFLSFFR